MLGCQGCWWCQDRKALAEKYRVHDPFEGCTSCCMFYIGCHSCMLIQQLKCVCCGVCARSNIGSTHTQPPPFHLHPLTPNCFRSHIKAVQLQGGLQRTNPVVPVQQQMSR